VLIRLDKSILENLGEILVTLVIRRLASLEDTVNFCFDVLPEDYVETTVNLCDPD